MDRRKLLAGGGLLAAVGMPRSGLAAAAPVSTDQWPKLWRRPQTKTLTIRPIANPLVHTARNDVTVGSNYPCPVRPRWVRAIFFNTQPTPWTVTGSAVAVSSRLNPANGTADTAYNETGAADDRLWAAMTFNNGGSFEPTPQNQRGGDVRSLTVPAVSNVNQPAMVASDWVAIPAAPRSVMPGPAYNIFHRAYAGPSALTWFCQGPLPPAAWLNLNYGGCYRGGDHANTAQNGPGGALALQSCYGLQVVADEPCSTIMTVGDSIQSGQGTTGYGSGMAQVAAITLQQQFRYPASFLAESVSGRLSVNFIPNGYNSMKDCMPDVAFIETISANDLTRTPSKATIDACTDRALGLVQFVKSLGRVPVLLTAAPFYTANGKGPGGIAEQLRRDSNTYVRSLAEQGMLVVDIDALLSTAPNSGIYAPNLGFEDHIHPNDAGTALCVNGTAQYPGYVAVCKAVFGL